MSVRSPCDTVSMENFQYFKITIATNMSNFLACVNATLETGESATRGGFVEHLSQT